ncbi:hypothetical protein X737_24940 [Mesorhizobium sp. L48C026A00]|nr:hypothetical protein X737_24940 [Mesorhizobium sp. L48C026A00]
MVKELNLAEERWAEHAKLVFQDFTDNEPDEAIIARLISH